MPEKPPAVYMRGEKENLLASKERREAKKGSLLLLGDVVGEKRIAYSLQRKGKSGLRV